MHIRRRNPEDTSQKFDYKHFDGRLNGQVKVTDDVVDVKVSNTVKNLRNSKHLMTGNPTTTRQETNLNIGGKILCSQPVTIDSKQFNKDEGSTPWLFYK